MLNINLIKINLLKEKLKHFGNWSLSKLDHLTCSRPLSFVFITVLVWFMVFNATFNNISVISWRSVLLVEETGVPGENH